MSRRSRKSDDDSKPSDESADIDDQEEVTRCVCGNDELAAIDSSVSSLLQQEYHIKVDTGLFIQCDLCLVWQHGYCVGLFTSEDVPDKYWCEECKPDLHREVAAADGKRTLYRPVNDSRKKLIAASTVELPAPERADSASAPERPVRLRSRRSPPEASPEAAGSDTNTRQARKERRHDDHDEQLQQALRESRSSDRAADQGANLAAAELEEADEGRPGRKRPRPRPKLRPKDDKTSEASKDVLLSQQSRPRFVNAQSTIYELRKRTGAILEWLGRTQMELEEERSAPLFDENLRLMERLTEKILAWEQRFGKYAP